MNGPTDEEIAANIAAIKRQSRGKRGSATRRTITVPPTPVTNTLPQQPLVMNNNNDDDLVGHHEESLSTTTDPAFVPRRSGRKRFSPQQPEKQPSAQQHQPQKSGRGSPRKDGSNTTTATNPGSKKKKKFSDEYIFQPRNAFPSVDTAVVNVPSARSSRKSTRQKEGAASSTAAVKPDIDFEFDPIHKIKIPLIDGVSKGTVTQTILMLLGLKGRYVADPNHLPACYWDVVYSMDDQDASFLPDGSGYRFRPEKEQLLLKNVAKHWKELGHENAPKSNHHLDNYGFKKAEHLAEPVLYNGEWIDNFGGLNDGAKRKIRKESNPIVSHIHIYRDGLKGLGCMETRENASRLMSKRGKEKRVQKKEIWLAFCGLNPGNDPKRVNAGLDPYDDDLVT